MHRLDAAAQLHLVEAAKARALPVAEQLDHARGRQGLVVAGVVEQAGRDVDRVAEDVARHFDDLAVRQADLELERHRRPGRQGLGLVGVVALGVAAGHEAAPFAIVTHADAGHRVVHVVGRGDALARRLEHRHQAIAQRLDDRGRRAWRRCARAGRRCASPPPSPRHCRASRTSTCCRAGRRRARFVAGPGS